MTGSAGARDQTFDHLKCYLIKDSLKHANYTVDLIPEQTQFLAETGCVLKVPAKWFCIDVEKTNVKPPPPGQMGGDNARDYLCYTLKCPKVQIPLTVEDQFGNRDIFVKKPDHLCVPANKVLPTQCCQFVAPSSLAGSCYDAVDATVSCQQHGGVAILAPLGQVCDATTGTCGTVSNTADGCCECARPSPPYPNPTECWNMVTGSSQAQICTQGCTFNSAGLTHCSPVTQMCE